MPDMVRASTVLAPIGLRDPSTCLIALRRMIAGRLPGRLGHGLRLRRRARLTGVARFGNEGRWLRRGNLPSGSRRTTLLTWTISNTARRILDDSGEGRKLHHGSELVSTLDFGRPPRLARPGRNGLFGRGEPEYALPNGWAISPAGQQIELGGLPLKLVSVPGSHYALATSNGYTEHFLGVIDVSTASVVQRLPIAEGWLGLTVTADGRRVYVSAGSRDRILVFGFAAGRLTPAGEIPLDAGTFPAGLCLNPSGNRLYVTANTANAILVVDLDSRQVMARIRVGIKPYTCLVTRDRRQPT